MENSKKINSISEVLNLLKKINHKPDKKLGQNFLVDENILNFILDSSEISDEDNVLEIGPGLGALTEKLFLNTNNLICIEKDKTLYSFLKNRFQKLEFINKDVLRVNPEELFENKSYKIISNLPYSVASRVIIMFAESKNPPSTMILTIQKEVAERLIALPGSKAYGVLSILTSVFYEIKILKNINPKCFFPAPKVFSSIVFLKKRTNPLVDKKLFSTFKKIVKFSFTQRRKQLGTSLKNMGFKNLECIFMDASFSLTDRPENLSINQWIEISSIYKNQDR
jgi:16S rRNA (adenine1518-N6/adenine1519-N6)-dimethyltransferase